MFDKPDIGDTPGVTIPQLASNFDKIDASLAEKATQQWIDFVQDCGADSTGVNDCTSALSTAASKLVNGGVLIIPAGTYKLQNTSTIALNDKANLKIIGLGQVKFNCTIPEPATNLFGAIGIMGAATRTEITVEVENIDFVQSGSTQNGYLSGLFIAQATNAYVKKVKASGFSNWGIFLDTINDARVEICECTSNYYGGLGFVSVQNINVDGGLYNSNGWNAPNYGYGISCKDSTSSTNNANLVIRGVTANSNLRKGIDVHSGHNLKIVDNTVIGFENVGIYAVNESAYNSPSDAGKDVRDVIIRNNFVDMTGATYSYYAYGIWVGGYQQYSTDSGDFIIDGNIIRNVYGVGINAAPALQGGLSPRRVKVVNNTVDYDSPNTYLCDALKVPTEAANGGVSTNVPIGEIHVANNSFKAYQCNYGIDIEQVTIVKIHDNIIQIDTGTNTIQAAINIATSTTTSMSITNNDITIGTGGNTPTVANGINHSGSIPGLVSGNKFFGGATITTPVINSGAINGQIVKDNWYYGGNQYALPLRNNIGSGISETWAISMPSSGSYYAGSIVWKTNPSITGTTGSQYILNGWKRITTGSNHVLNTDWVEMHTLTGT